MRGLPEGWASAPMSDVASIIMGQSPPSSSYNDVGLGLPFLQGKAEFGPLCPQPMKWCTNAKKVAEGNDVLLSVRAPVGPTNLSPMRCCIGRGLAALRPLRGMENRFVLYQIRAREHELARRGHGVTFEAIRKKELASWPTFVAPTGEQHRIIAKIEDLFAKLDVGLAALKRAQENLKRYRATVLKAAVEGRLTERWRRKNPPEESGEELLGRILVERRKRWETEQLTKFEAKGEQPPRNWKKKYREPVAPDASSGLPRLPEGWCWATVDQVGNVGSGITKGGKKRDETRRAVPYLRVANVQRGQLDLGAVKTILASDDEIRRYSLKNGDVLFNEGGDRDKLGRGWVWRGDLSECLHQNHVFRVRPFLRDYSSEFLSHYGNSAGREWFFRRATQSVNLASINQTVLRSLPVPLPPLREQKHIVRRLADALRSVEFAGTELIRQLIRASSLRQSILKSAFQGSLVPQDPNDEPASVLLERIRIEREAESKKRKLRPSKPRRQGKSQLA